MKIQLVVVAGACLALGAAAGYKFALVREHDHLERNQTLIRRTHTEVWSEPNIQKSAQAARELYAPHFVLHDWTGDDASGLPGVIKSISDNRADFPDWSEHVESIMAQGGFVADIFLSTGTQARDLQPILHHSPAVPSHGKFLRMPEMSMYRIVDGKVAEQWDFADIWTSHIQLGLYDPDHWTESICGVPEKQEQDDAGVLKEMLASEYRIVGALARDDIEGFAKLLPEDVMDIDGDGVHTKAEWIPEFRKQKDRGYLFRDFRFDNPKLIRLGPGQATLTAKEIIHGLDKGKPFELRSWTNSTYVRRNGKWLPRVYQDTPLEK